MTEEKNNQNKKEKNREKEDCPLCKISEDTIRRLKEGGESSNSQEKKEK